MFYTHSINLRPSIQLGVSIGRYIISGEKLLNNRPMMTNLRKHLSEKVPYKVVRRSLLGRGDNTGITNEYHRLIKV